MRKLIVSPHSDDAIFSIGAFLSNQSDVFIITPFMGIPDDEAGKNKHETLSKEHNKACKIIGAKHIDGDFLDDVYPDLNHDRLREFLYLETAQLGADEIYIPLGIHHHDHMLVADFMMDILDELNIEDFYFYEELPYKKLYPEKTKKRIDRIKNRYGDVMMINPILYNTKKDSAIRAYVSQTDNQLISILQTPEIIRRVW